MEFRSREARYTPDGMGHCLYTKEKSTMDMGVVEARAPCRDDVTELNIEDNRCLQHCEDADQFLDYTNARQVRDGYVSVSFVVDLPRVQPYVWESHYIGGIPVQLNPTAWLYELQYEHDGYLKSYIKEGILTGFEVVDSVQSVPDYDSCNYPSVVVGPPNEYIGDLITKELTAGKYLVVQGKPKCIHSLGAVEKSDKTYRPITDCSRPKGEAVNNYMNNTHQSFVYNSVDDVSRMMRPGIYSATVDISSAYRAIPIREEHRQCQGIRWKVGGELSYLVDTHMCFGAKCAPYTFTQVGNFIVRCMNRRGYHGVLNYIDDFICFGDSFTHCQEVQATLINLLMRLGFHISWKKCSSPSLVTKYLGLWFDSRQMQLTLPEEKLSKLHGELKFFEHKSRATRHQLQKLCGILSHCARVVHGGRTFSRRICAMLKGLQHNRRIRLNQCFKRDLQWWSRFSEVFNGRASIIKYNYGEGPWFATDASASGYGIFSSGDWLAGYFTEDKDAIPSTMDNGDPCHGHWQNIALSYITPKDNNINFWELVPVLLALRRYAAGCQGMHIVGFSDNSQVVHAINKGVSSNESSMQLLREIFWECVKYNVHLSARYIPGEINIIPDILSRLNNIKFLRALNSFDLCCRSAEFDRD